MKTKLSFILLFSSMNALSWCPRISMTDIPTQVNLNNNISPKTQVTLDRGDSYSGCNVRIGITKGSASNYNRKIYNGTKSIDFNISKKNSMTPILMNVSDSSGTTNIITESFKASRPKSTEKINLFAELTLSGNEQSGSYSDSFDITIYQQFFGLYFYHSSWPITYVYNVPNNIHLSLVDTNQPFDIYDVQQDISFGTIVKDDSRNFDIVVQSNSGYTLYASSANNGKLKHENSQEKIDYSFKTHGQSRDLSNSNASPIEISSSSSTNSEHRVNVVVEVGDPTNKLAGYYEDQLVITVETNL